jgi:hypothetical protein
MRAARDKIARSQFPAMLLADPLRGVAHKWNFPGHAKLADFAPRLVNAGDIIRRHDKNRAGAPTDERFDDPSQIDNAIACRWN